MYNKYQLNRMFQNDNNQERIKDDRLHENSMIKDIKCSLKIQK